MVERTLVEEIQLIIRDEINNIGKPTKCTVQKLNPDGSVDIEYINGYIKYVPCIGAPSIGSDAILLFINGDFNRQVCVCVDAYSKEELAKVATTGSYTDLTDKPSYTPTVTPSTTGAYVIGSLNISGTNQTIYGKDTGGGGGGTVILGTGAFTINSSGHLIVELPDGVDNPYYINSSGHIIYDTSNSHNTGE